MACVGVDVEKGTFSLKSEHQILALRHLALNTPLEVLDVAAFLLRDYEFPNHDANSNDLIDEFAARFMFGSREQLRPLFVVPPRDGDLVNVLSAV